MSEIERKAAATGERKFDCLSSDSGQKDPSPAKLIFLVKIRGKV